MEEEVGECAGAFLVGRVGRLEDESGLYGEEEAGRVEELEAGVRMELGVIEYVWKGLTGCAEKKMSFWEKMAPQTMAARIQMPACAMGAVPGRRC
jgi:hypothetical protein